MLEKTKAKLLDETVDTRQRIVVSAPKFRYATIGITGTAPYVGNKMAARDMKAMRANQEAGQQAKSKKKREPKDFSKLHLEKIHYSQEGWAGIPCSAFRNAMIRACALVGYKMTNAKMSVFIEPDGFDRDDGQPLVRLYSPHEPRSLEMIGRLSNGSTDILVRPQWMQWSCKIKVKWDEDQFSAQDVSNLLMRAGEQVGVGAGRPFSAETAGLGFGTFKISDDGFDGNRKGGKRKQKTN